MNPFVSTNPARLDRRLTLLSPTTARDGAGGVIVSTWEEVATVWADWTPTPGREVQQSSQFISLPTGTARIRYRAGILSTWRVRLEGALYELVAPPIEVGRRVYLDLVLRGAGPGEAANELTDEAGNVITDEVGEAITT